MTAHVQSNWWATTLKRHVPWNQRTKWPGKSTLMETQVTHLMFVHVDRKDTSVDDPRTENDEKTIETHKECANAAENSVPRKARIVEKSGCNKTWVHERNT